MSVGVRGTRVAFLIGGVFAFLLAMIFLVVGIVQFNKLGTLENARAYTIQELRAHHNKGGFRQQCLVKGTIECDEPLIAPLSNKPCVIYRQVIVREREEEYRVERASDPDGYDREISFGIDRSYETKRRQVSDRLPDEDQRVPFWLYDGEARVLVDPAGAKLELEKAAEKFERTSGMPISGNRTLGINYTEYILPIGAEGHIIGWAEDQEGRLVVGRPPANEKQQFLISDRRSEDLIKASTITAAVTLTLAIVLSLVALVLVVLGLS